jgi:hypothetical protein
MLTLQEHPENVQICILKDGKKKQPVWWHPTVQPELRSEIEDLNYFFGNPDFQDRFELNHEQCEDIKSSLTNNTVSEKHQSKHFQCKRFITQVLNDEMDLMDSSASFEFQFPNGGNTYPWCHFVCGSSGSGKSRWILDQLKNNLDGPKPDRRHVLWFSAELTIDRTIAPLRDNEKYREWFTGVDISEKAVEDSQYQSPEEFFEKEIRLRIDTAPEGTLVVADDAMDSEPVVAELMRRLMIKLMRVGRHRKVGLIYSLHKLASGQWSSQAYSSCQNIVVFPRSNKNKIRKFLEDEIGMTRKEARRAVKDFGQSGRALIVRLHAPQLLMSEKLIRLL